MGKHILITGHPGVGKTTLIRKIAEALGAKAGGFYTQEIRVGRERVGFGIQTLAGVTGTLSHKAIHSRRRVGKYGVDVEAFESVALPALRGALREKEFIIIDEIGPMEECSEPFKDLVVQCLNSEKRVLATIKERGSRFVETIKARDDCRIFHLDLGNRDRAAEEILKAIALGARRTPGQSAE